MHIDNVHIALAPLSFLHALQATSQSFIITRCVELLLDEARIICCLALVLGKQIFLKIFTDFCIVIRLHLI